MVVRPRGFCENSRVRGHIKGHCTANPYFVLVAAIEVAIKLFSGIYMFLISICMHGRLKNLNAKIILNHPKRAIGKFIPSISHDYSTVDPSCAVIAQILQWLYDHVVFAKFLGYVAIYLGP